MRFQLDAEQREFARTLDAMLTAADVPSAVRAWSTGDFAPGRALWSRLAEAGVFALAVPEEYEGVGPLAVELAVAYVELGRHAVPGPVVETAAVAGLLAATGDSTHAKRLLPGIAAGSVMATVKAPGGPYALDAEAADLTVTFADGALHTCTGHGPTHRSADPARRLTEPGAPAELLTSDRAAFAATDAWGTLASAAQALGVGRALLDRTVAYVKQRRQFGTEIGAFQAVKHQLADVLLKLEFAAPLLYGAALTMSRADLAAAKVSASEAAYAASRVALQLHGAIGYTEELDLSLWIRKAQVLRTAWGSPAECRARVVAGAR
ncbi:acyl-CoA dehydrogenase family protein [Streptomyces sp. LHD-70]|uniref:acyl-CoA dehydrogenase family protein n=1 Tax=Streptomyces sp. LHD-70 TaxID=3072140 RepID=UPI00280D7CF5|nr:acyl-CoA dehydrogenase family protein [Streptomyces sp. LHD-70]MDQ8701576.1 acyl-CoA dehydrogenase family protein [Streptomyces sp. LHD-70]